MANSNLTPSAAQLEEALTVLFCLIDDAYHLLNPGGSDAYSSLKRLSDSEVLTLALFQQLRGLQSERSFLRDAARFFSHLFPGVVGLHPSSLHRRVRKLRRFLEPLRRSVVRELVGDPETLVVDSTLLSVLHPRQVRQSAGWGEASSGAAWVRWGSFSIYGMKLHLICSTNRVPLSYELTAASTADVVLVEELLEAAHLGDATARRRLFGDLAYRSEALSRMPSLAAASCWQLSGRSGFRQRGSRWRSALRRSRGPSVWAALWPRRSPGWRPGSRPRSVLTLTASTSTGSSAGRRGASRSCGPEILATHI
jgi:hypothetical protein